MESNSSVKRHPVSYRLFIRICSICFLGTTEYIRALLVIHGENSRRRFSIRITCESGYDIRLKYYISILIIPHILLSQIHLNVSITQIIDAIGIGSHGINRLSGRLRSGLYLLGKLCYLSVLIDLPAICRSIYRYCSSTCSLELPLCANCVMCCRKLCYIINNMLFKRRIILDQLSFLVKLQPVFDRISVKSYCLIPKCIRDTCFRKIVVCIYSCLKISTVTCDIGCDISIRIASQIYFRVITADGLTDHLISFFYLQLTSCCLRHNSELRIIKTYVCIFRSYLILLLCTVQRLHLILQLGLVKSCLLFRCIGCFFKKTFHPFIRFLLFQKIQYLST